MSYCIAVAHYYYTHKIEIENGCEKKGAALRREKKNTKLLSRVDEESRTHQISSAADACVMLYNVGGDV